MQIYDLIYVCKSLWFAPVATRMGNWMKKDWPAICSCKTVETASSHFFFFFSCIIFLLSMKVKSWCRNIRICTTGFSMGPLQQERTLQCCHLCPLWPVSNYQEHLTIGARHHHLQPNSWEQRNHFFITFRPISLGLISLC